MPKYDASKLMYRKFETDRFINRLNVDDDHVAFMRKARTKVRNKLKASFTKAKSNDIYLSRMDEADQSVFKNIEPRFWPQGSFAYGTQNLPAKAPPQQLDIDDGVYLPIEALRDRPIVNKQIFFDIVDTALRELAEEENWLFKEKNTCARLELDPQTHLDVPLYAIPVERFEDLQKAMGRVALNQEQHLAEEEPGLRRILSDQEVYLAVRDNVHWIKSDPIRIQEWFEHEQAIFGDSLTRVCRYFKAWRDQRWEKGGPSSIAIMICVWEVFKEASTPFYLDCDAIHAVCKQLPSKLQAGVKNPVAVDETIFPRGIGDIEHKKILSITANFCNDIISVLDNGDSAKQVADVFVNHWGERLPLRPDWVEVASVAAAGVVGSTQATPQAKPNLGTMRSGYRSA